MADNFTIGGMFSEDLPEDWGGRPKGSTRRAIRMQEEWDKKRERQMVEYKVARGAYEADRSFYLQERDQQMQENDFLYNRGLKEAEEKLQAQQRSEAAAIVNSLNQLDPRSPDYQKNVATIFGKNPLGAADENVQRVAAEYGEANKIYMTSLTDQYEQQKAEEEQQAEIQANIIKYDLTPEQQADMLVPNLPAGVVKFDPNRAKPIIAKAEKAIAAKEETKVREKESASRFDDYNKALATYEGLVADRDAEQEDVAKARAAARGAAAVLGIPKVVTEEDLQNYKSGERVLAPDGITVITVP